MKVLKTAAVSLFVALGLKNADKWNDARMSAKLGKIKEMVDEDVKLEGSEQELLSKVMAAAEAGEQFEVENDEPAAETAEPKAAKAAKAPKAPKQSEEDKAAAKAAKEAAKAAAEAAKAEAKAAALAAKVAAKEAAKAAKEAAKPKKAERPTKAFLAGQAIAKAGGLDKVKKADIKALYEDWHSDAIVNITYYRSIGGIRGFLGVETKEPTRLDIAGRLLKEHGLEVTDALVKLLDEQYGTANEKESKTALNHTVDVIRGFQSVEVAEAADDATEDAA